MRKIILVSVGLAFVAGFLLVGPSVAPAEQVKITVCHFPPDSPGDFHTIHVGSQKAADKHLVNHPGDFLGECCSMIDDICGPPENDCKAWDCAANSCVAIDVQCDALPCMDFVECLPNGGCEYTDRVCPTGEVCDTATDQCEVPSLCPCWNGSEGSAGTSLEAIWAAVPSGSCGYQDLCKWETVPDYAGSIAAGALCSEPYGGGGRYVLSTFSQEQYDLDGNYVLGNCSVTEGASQTHIMLYDLAQNQACMADIFEFTNGHDGNGCGLPSPGSP